MKKSNKILTIAVVLFSMTAFAQQNDVRYEKGFEFEYSRQVNTWHDQVGEPGGFKFDAYLIKPVNSVKLMFVNGAQLGDYLFFGAGIGLDYAKWNVEWRTMAGSMQNDEYSVSMPIFARIKFLFFNKKVAPFLNFDVGGNVLLASIWKMEARNNCYRNHGLMMKPGIGLNISFDSGKQFYFVVQYDYNYIPFNHYYPDHNIHSIGTKIGFLF